MRITRPINPTLWLTLALTTGTVHAGGHVYTATDPTWKAECGSCHVAYPPQLLPAQSWRKLMAGLNDHFGTDASLDAKTAESITRFLEAKSATAPSLARGPRLDPIGDAPIRITETVWFRKEHDEVPARAWKNPVVKSAANCAACHTRAEQGDYSKRTRRVPQ